MSTAAGESSTDRNRGVTLWDRVLMHDIGLVKLFAGGRVLFCIPAGMAAGYAVSLVFGLPAVVGLMLGALPAFLSCFVIVDEEASRVAVRSAALYVPFVVALFCSIALREFRILELALIVGLLFVQFYSSRFGVWAGDFGAGLFAAYLCGLLLPLPLASFPALALVFAASLAATIAIRSLVFHPNAFRSLMRSRRAFLAWETRVLESASEALTSREPRVLKKLQRRRKQAQVAALIADGLLAKPGAGPTGEVALALHTLLFDTEQAVDGLARVATELAEAGAPRELRTAVADAIDRVVSGGGREGDRAASELLARAERGGYVATAGSSADERAAGAGEADARATHAGEADARATQENGAPTADNAWAHAISRATLLLSDLAASADDWSKVRTTLPRSGDGVPFESPVVLFGGRPAGAAPILNAEIASGLAGPWRRLQVSPALRTAIQAAVAVAIAEPIAFLIDGQRFYWAVIGVMVILAGTNSTHDRLRKVVSRGLGTVIGGVIGIATVAVLGTAHPWWTLALVVVCLAGGMYSITSSYTLWTTGLVITLCQVYDFSGQFTDSLIAYRLAENLLGALIAVGVSLVVLPVATGVMIRRAQLRQLAAVRAFLETAAQLGDGPENAARMRSASRAVDQACFQLDAVLKPLVRIPVGAGTRREDAASLLLSGVRGAISGISYRGERHSPLTPEQASAVRGIVARLTESLDAVSHAVGGTPIPSTDYVSVAGPISDLSATLSGSDDDDLLGYRLRGLARIDEALGELAELHGLTVRAADSPGDVSRVPALRSGTGTDAGTGPSTSAEVDAIA